MAQPRKPHQTTSDDDLLAHAIPIERAASGGDRIDHAAAAEQEAQAVDLTNPEADAIELATDEAPGADRKIESFDHHREYRENWKRQPSKTGHGATHVRTFVAKLRLDAIEHLDEQVNEWLDSHPEYEVKIVSTSVGLLTGKLREEALFITVWV